VAWISDDTIPLPDFVSIQASAPAFPTPRDFGNPDSPGQWEGNALHSRFPFSNGFSLLQLEKVQNMAKLLQESAFELTAESHTFPRSVVQDVIFFRLLAPYER